MLRMLLRDDQWVRIETLLPGKSGDRGRSGANNATLLPVDWLFATIDCTLKIVGPAAGERLIAHGRVLKYGRLLTVATAEVYIESGGRRELTATALATTWNIEPTNPSR